MASNQEMNQVKYELQPIYAKEMTMAKKAFLVGINDYAPGGQGDLTCGAA